MEDDGRRLLKGKTTSCYHKNYPQSIPGEKWGYWKKIHTIIVRNGEVLDIRLLTTDFDEGRRLLC